MTISLSGSAHDKSEALGRWFADMAPDAQPHVVLCSPYLRARETAQAIRDAGRLSASFSNFIVDERLREKEFGILDRLTRLGIEQKHPDQAATRSLVGKFYFLRLRSVLDTISIHYSGKRVLTVAHQVVLCMRYLLENLDEQAILAIEAERDVANCAVTEYAPTVHGTGSNSPLESKRYNFVAPLEREGTTVTAEPYANTAVR